MDIYTKIKWPRLPDSLHDVIINSAIQGLEKDLDLHHVVSKHIPDYYSKKPNSSGFKTFDLPVIVNEWLYDNIPILKTINVNDHPARIQVTNSTYPQWHRDKRPWAINYLVKSGGKDVRTVFLENIVLKKNKNILLQKYYEQSKIIHEHKAVENEWYFLKYVDVYPHAAVGIEEGNFRVLLSLGQYWFMTKELNEVIDWPKSITLDKVCNIIGINNARTS
jgi:hypothetical protein